MLGGKSIALNAYIRKQEMSEIYDHFKKLEKEKQNTWGKENYKEQKQMREKRQMEKISNVIFEKRYK